MKLETELEKRILKHKINVCAERLVNDYAVAYNECTGLKLPFAIEVPKIIYNATKDLIQLYRLDQERFEQFYNESYNILKNNDLDRVIDRI